MQVKHNKYNISNNLRNADNNCYDPLARVWHRVCTTRPWISSPEIISQTGSESKTNLFFIETL